MLTPEFIIAVGENIIIPICITFGICYYLYALLK